MQHVKLLAFALPDQRLVNSYGNFCGWWIILWKNSCTVTIIYYLLSAGNMLPSRKTDFTWGNFFICLCTWIHTRTCPHFYLRFQWVVFSPCSCMKCPYRTDAWMERQPKMVRMDLIKNISVYLLEWVLSCGRNSSDPPPPAVQSSPKQEPHFVQSWLTARQMWPLYPSPDPHQEQWQSHCVRLLEKMQWSQGTWRLTWGTVGSGTALTSTGFRLRLL